MIPLKIRALLWYLNWKGVSYHQMTPQKARGVIKKTSKKFKSLVEDTPTPLPDVHDRMITMRDGIDIKIRIYCPNAAQDLPVIVYFHGGGFVINDIETHDSVCRIIAKKNQAVVVSVDYRLAPEFKFPIPTQDCYDATVWVAEHAEELGVDQHKLVVMGDSAGGNLATVTAIMARDLNGPAIAAQVLIYPCTDGRLRHPSVDKNGKGYLLTKDLMVWFMNHYLVQEDDKLNPHFSPLLMKDLTNLPPAFVMTAQYDPLLDEGYEYALRLQEAGVPTNYKMYKGMIHAFFGMTKLTKVALKAQTDIQDFLTEQLEKAPVYK